MKKITLTIDGVTRELELIGNNKKDNCDHHFIGGEWYREAEPETLGYEILSFNFREGFWDFKNGFYRRECFLCYYDLTNMLTHVKEGNAFIHSVKRLTDNEVFSIGDKHRYSGGITQFKIDSNDIKISFDDDCGWDNLSDMQKSWFVISTPTILLTTEDGVEIMDGEQKVYGVSDYFITISTKARNAGASIYKYFSTEAARDEYIFQNKPITTTWKEFWGSPMKGGEFFKSKQK